ncbi:hypothetical protein BZG36_02138 [Bifiguratus adelaidae]|uniref:Uncharacterized protein n=1 Tax=Bifiguratus adelaidae TaxID=1938954 RepID=A0A261Y378_9FUNG|nr:hypothetical protein BZG36_02138 [Bifiguratus adelaidae]
MRSVKLVFRVMCLCTVFCLALSIPVENKQNRYRYLSGPHDIAKRAPQPSPMVSSQTLLDTITNYIWPVKRAMLAPPAQPATAKSGPKKNRKKKMEAKNLTKRNAGICKSKKGSGSKKAEHKKKKTGASQVAQPVAATPLTA